MEDAYFWIIENDLGEGMNVIYQHDPDLSDEWLDLLEERRWHAIPTFPPEPAWEFFQSLKDL